MVIISHLIITDVYARHGSAGLCVVSLGNRTLGISGNRSGQGASVEVYTGFMASLLISGKSLAECLQPNTIFSSEDFSINVVPIGSESSYQAVWYTFAPAYLLPKFSFRVSGS